MQDNARPQARKADIQPLWLHSGADRRAEPLPQGCPAAGSHQQVTGMRLTLPGCLAFPCLAAAFLPAPSHRQSRGDAEVSNPESPFPKRKLQSRWAVGGA